MGTRKIVRTGIVAVVGGTTSEIAGGKFANGAVSGAFVQMYNVEWITYAHSNVQDHVVGSLTVFEGFRVVWWERTATALQFRFNNGIEYNRTKEVYAEKSNWAFGLRTGINTSIKKSDHYIYTNPWTNKVHVVK